MNDEQNFQAPAPDFDGESPAERQPHASDEVLSTLSSYLRSIGQLPPVSDQTQEELGKLVNARLDDLLTALSAFGSVLEELAVNAGRVATGAIRQNELLAPFSYQSAGANPAAVAKNLTAWKNELEHAYQLRKQAFADATPWQPDARYVELVGKYRFMPDVYTDLTDDIVGAFPPATATGMAELAAKHLLPEAEIPGAVAELSNALRRLREARNHMLEHNLRLVVVIARNYAARVGSTVSINDIVQEGNLGLLRAIEKYDFRLGYKFSTYAIWWIRQNISRFLAEKSRIIRIPAHMIQTISAMNGAEQRFIMENGREPEIEELAMALEMPVARINAIRKMARQPISLQLPTTDGLRGEGGTLEDILADEEGETPSEHTAQLLVNEQLKRVIGMLNERERTILIERFGLFGHAPRTLSELSARFGITRERIRQLEARTLKKLRSPEMLGMFDRQSGGKTEE